MSKKKIPLIVLFATICVAALPLPSQAMHLDSRFEHNQYYHDRGEVIRAVPRGAYTVRYRGGEYLYHGGEWYHRNGRAVVVIAAPIGAFVPALPAFYSTVWWGGVPYYYADDTYYTWNSGEDEYEVVEPPSGIENGGSTQAPPTDSIFVYPKSGQSADQQAQDRFECHRSAVAATGYDPTVSGGGVPADVARNKRADYMRAQAACLDARGYSVK
ncbi:MAG TPA: DUF6515 family protein [Steroidobacteraceae bacterium]|nr:DUF6515 family protein [Steroidobacteraceae bacterium]